MTLDDVRVPGSSYLLSLTKLAGQPIADLQGYISYEFGDPTFKLCKLVLASGVEIRVEGEHDMPYLTPFEDAPAALQSENLAKLDPP